MTAGAPSRRTLAGWALLPLLGGLARAEPRSRFVLATGPTGGGFSAYGPVLAKIAEAHAAIGLDLLSTAGSYENLQMLIRSEADLALASMGPAYAAWAGQSPFEPGATESDLRALFPVYETPFCFVALSERGISSLSYAEGRKVGVGPAGGSGERLLAALATAHGLRITLVSGARKALARDLLAGEIDLLWLGGPLPHPVIRKVTELAEAAVFGLSEAEIGVFQRLHPFATAYELPAGVYRGQSAPVRTAAVWNFVLTTARFPDEAAHDLTKAALEHTAEMAAALPAAAGTSIANVRADTFLPLHPGAAAYYRGRDVALPPAIVPR